MLNITNITTALVRINKRAYYYFDTFSVTKSEFTKYPIFLDALLSRIKTLLTKYSISSLVRVYDLALPGAKAKARKDLLGKGGIYCF